MLLAVPTPPCKVTVALIAAVTLTACTSGATESSFSNQSTGEFTSVAIFGQNTEASHIHIEEGVSLCMKKEGFDYTVKPFEEPEERDSREIRAESGFGYSSGEPFADSDQSFVPDDDQFPDSVQTEEEIAAYTAKEVECQEKAAENLAMLVTEFIDQLDADDKALYDSVVAFDHPDLTLAHEKWAECMTTKGFDYSSPFDMLQYALETFTEPSTLNEEVSLALADWDCSATPEVTELQDSAYAELDSRLEGSFTETIKEN